MKFRISEGISSCTIITCTLSKDDNLPELALQSLKLFPLNQQMSVMIPADQRFNTKSFCCALQKYHPNKVMVAGREPIDVIADTFSYQLYASPEEFYEAFQKNDLHNENILVFETDRYKLKKAFLDARIRPTTLSIDLGILAENIQYFRSKLNPNTRLLTMLKAFSYGSGSYEMGCLMQFLKVDYLGVAASDEGVSLRRSGITMPIIILTPEVENIDRMIRYNLEPEIYNIRSLNAFIQAVDKVGLSAYPIHIKIDSGMHRQGFEKNEIDELASVLGKSNSVKVISVFTHLAAADEEKYDDFTRQQLSLFDEIAKMLEEKLGYKLIRHALNSAGIERFTEYQFEMVRLGIGMYGGSQVNPEAKIVSTLRSVITQVKDIIPGDTVGYGRKGEVKGPTRIGVVPIGYADGLNRKFSNGVGRFVVNGQSAPIIGNVCMDLTMIDITGLEVKEGDEVAIFGKDPTVFELADKLGTITHEILASIAARVKRVYTFTEKLFDL